ncbi:GNAT family N-acetyltransferase [Acinetobacter sp. RIT698]|jgi:putative acetyltransferase|uniref:GNAT family N-acetyltransferase n=1 Tax=Acinetobacter TaxID=469 RepID=UPI0004EF66E7|nr:MULTISPECIES: GNAT family N-acetyltransferase [Acinetobacter]MBP2543072.1 putative acetyltransferase [Acinetobacter guillouiae]MCG7220721.1 GNAT family N-acetyltransferase [Acinetobacter sp. AG3]MRT38126.1 GNAT family N-acetyltransferase [Acinetobacter sp. RIT698]UOH16604.1 GNAT family N-acetyltransferase [Acinetobacter sp. NyZ410]BAP37201.1 putative N-acetyltransferase [Acinetobacter guillouiae]
MYQIRTIQIQDNPSIAQVIREVSKEFGLAPESGFAVADPILDDLYQVYAQPNAQYWIIEDANGRVVGGGGLSPLQGDATVLEIQKMYFLPELRGLGFAKKILEKCFEFAQQQGFQSCYLETTQDLWQAIKLYEKLGFEHLSQPKGNTGHSHVCEVWMLKTLL